MTKKQKEEFQKAFTEHFNRLQGEKKNGNTDKHSR